MRGPPLQSPRTLAATAGSIPRRSDAGFASGTPTAGVSPSRPTGSSTSCSGATTRRGRASGRTAAAVDQHRRLAPVVPLGLPEERQRIEARLPRRHRDWGRSRGCARRWRSTRGRSGRRRRARSRRPRRPHGRSPAGRTTARSAGTTVGALRWGTPGATVAFRQDPGVIRRPIADPERSRRALAA